MNVTIEKIEIASFGKLKNAVVAPKEGINILSAPNESGKSTLAAFVKFVFYGFSGSRMQSLTDNERKLYTPWDGDVSEGRITIKADGEGYIIRRKALSTGKDNVEIISRRTGCPVFQGEAPGEVFFGVGEDIFSRTLFFRQLTVPQTKDEVLADRLRNIAISADEQVGTKKAVSRLTESKNELKGRGGNGLIPKAEKERDRLEELVTASVDMRREVSRLQGEIKKRSSTIAQAEEKLKLLDAERLNIEKYDALLRLQNVNRLTVEENIASEEYEKASAGLKQNADSEAFGALSAKNAELVAEQRNADNLLDSLEQAEEEHKELLEQLPIDSQEAKETQAEIEKWEKIAKICFAAGVLFAVLGFLVYMASSSPAGFLGLAAGVVACAVGGVLLGKPASIAKDLGFETSGELKKAIENIPFAEKQLKEKEKRCEALKIAYEEAKANAIRLKSDLDGEISKYTDIYGGDYQKQIQFILSASAESGEKLAVWRSKKRELETALQGVDVITLSENARGAVEPERDKSRVDRDISFYKTQHQQLSELNRRDELESASLEAKSGDPATMIGKRDSLNERISDLTVKHKAYETAIRAIEEASDYMKSMVAPRIGQRADEYFTAATGGKYTSFEVDTKLSMSFGEDFRRSCDYLSAGTRDSAYLSLRLALADMLFGGCGVPIMLDDAFVRIDDNRLRMISGAVNEAAKKHQIIILTHGDREMNAMDDIGVEYNNISIKTV